LNSAFQPAAAIQSPAPPSFWEQPQLWNIARQILGAVLVLALAYFILRPMMQVLTRPQPVAAAPASLEYAAQMYPAAAGGRPMALPMNYDDRMAAARSVAGQDPRQIAQVVRNWVAEDNG
jgi:flagellar M-ring protein FliF